MLRSEWTIAALQKRFAALEQRLASMEQREEERQRSERVEAAARARREEEQQQVVLGSSTDTAPDQSQAHWQEVEQPQFVEAEFEPREAGTILHAQTLKDTKAVSKSILLPVAGSFGRSRTGSFPSS
jgi:hypothetical protein